MTKCSKNLTKHIQLLKDEKNHIMVLQANGYVVEEETISQYLHHLQYVKALIRNEKHKMFTNILNKRLTNFNR